MEMGSVALDERPHTDAQGIGGASLLLSSGL